MTTEDKLKAVDEAINRRHRCLCGLGESCDECYSFSALNRLREELHEILHGPRPKMKLEDYGKHLTFKMEDICPK